jgi:uncharacterized protein with PQ loop repeat
MGSLEEDGMENIQVAAGFMSSVIFITSNLPMLFKAFKTKDLKSYSPIHIILSNVGNFLYWLYVISLPVGPIWFLHGFFTLSTLLMLAFYLRYESRLGRFLPVAAARIEQEMSSH